MCAAQMPNVSGPNPFLRYDELSERLITSSNDHAPQETPSNESIDLADSSSLEKLRGRALQEKLSESKVAQSFAASVETTKPITKEEYSQRFAAAITEAKAKSEHGAYVHAYSQEEYMSMKLLLLADSSAGLAVNSNGEIVSVFKHPECQIKALLDVLIPEGIRMGGVCLDCFNGALPLMYSKYGFVPVAKVEFKDEFAPDDWNFDRDGRRDIIFMTLDRDRMSIDHTGFSTMVQKDRTIMIEQLIENLNYETDYANAAEKTQKLLKEKDVVLDNLF